MTTSYTVEQLEAMNSTDLRVAASKLGVKNVKTYVKAELLKMCLDKMPIETQFTLTRKDFSDPSKTIAVEVVEVPNILVAKAIKERKLSFGSTKTSQIIEMHKAGARKIEISKALNAHYSFVNTVLKKAEKA